MRLTLSALLLPLLAFSAVPTLAHAGDAAAGQHVFGQCRTCHLNNDSGKSTIGPNLHGLIGRTAGTFAGYHYSPAMQAKGQSGLVWNDDNLRQFVTNPHQDVPGTKMPFAGLHNPDQVENLIAYLEQATKN
jgi:cytochrome c